MEVQVNKEAICINKLITNKKEEVSIEGDVIVPDTKPDILNSINISGNVIIYKREIKEDKIKIEGTIDTYVMYLPDSNEDKLRALNCNLDFSKNVEMPSISEDMDLEITPKIKEMECKVINGRKISVKALIEFKINVYSNEETEIIINVDNVENIQKLQKSLDINCLVGSGRTNVYAKETLKLNSQDEFAEILNTKINLVNQDIKISYNKLLAKIEAKVKILYLTEDNRVENIECIIPAVGFIDIQNISEENECEVNCIIKNIQIKPNQEEETSIYIEIEIEESCMVTEKKQINLIEDLYSPTTNVEFSQKTIEILTDSKEQNKEYTINKEIEVPILDKENLLYTEVNPNILETNISKSKIKYTGDVNINFIFMKDNIVNSKKDKIPFEVSIENIFESEDITEDNILQVINSNYDVNNGKIDTEITLNLNVNLFKNLNVNAIDNVEIVEDETNEEDYDSLVLYITQPGDTLWKIAKKFNSTVDELTRMNGIEDENKIDIGQKIYIPKFNFTRIENEEKPTFM